MLLKLSNYAQKCADTGPVPAVHANGQSAMDRLDWLMALMSWLYYIVTRFSTLFTVAGFTD